MSDHQTALQQLVDEIRDAARDLVHDAATWRESADMTGAASRRLILRADALVNEAMASKYERWADEISAFLSPTDTAPVETPQGKATCCHCGMTFGYAVGNRAEYLIAAGKVLTHARECAQNPLMQRIAELERQLEAKP